MKIKDGFTLPAYTAEHAVDLDTGEIVAITTQSCAVDDGRSIQETVSVAGLAVAGQLDTPTAQCEYPVHG